MNPALQIFQSKIRHNKVAVLTLFFRSTGQANCGMFIVERQKGTVEITQKWENLKIGDKFPEKVIASGLPIYVHVSGEGVMVREISGLSQSDPLSEVLPGFNEKDYFFQIDSLKGEKRALSLVRKDLVLRILNEGLSDTICYAGLMIGPSPFIALSSHLDEQHSKIVQVGEYLFNREDGIINGIQKVAYHQEEPVQTHFFGESRSYSEMAVLSCGILALSNPSGYKYNETVFNHGYKESFSSLLGRMLLKGALGGLFLLLLINYLIFDYYFKQGANLDKELTNSTSILSDLTDLKTDLDLKQKFISDNRLNDYYYLSYYADQVGQLAGHQIRLEKLAFNPLTKSIKPGQQINFQKGIIWVEGTADNVEAYQEFLAEVKLKVWSLELISQDYLYRPGQKNANFRFEIRCDFNVLRQ